MERQPASLRRNALRAGTNEFMMLGRRSRINTTRKTLPYWKLEAGEALMSGTKKFRVAGCVVMAGICLLPVRGKAQTSANATEDLRALMTTALSAARQGDQ